MPLIREYSHILWIFTADRQTADHGEKTGFFIPAVDAHCIFTCIGAVNKFLIRRQPHGAGRCQIARILGGGGGNSLYLLNHRRPVAGFIRINADYILQLMHQIKETSVGAVAEMSWSRLQVAVDGIYLKQPLILVVETVYLYLVRSIVHRQNIPAVRHPSGTGNMRAEVALSHAAVSLVEHLVHNLPHRTVLVKA